MNFSHTFVPWRYWFFEHTFPLPTSSPDRGGGGTAMPVTGYETVHTCHCSGEKEPGGHVIRGSQEKQNQQETI